MSTVRSASVLLLLPLAGPTLLYGQAGQAELVGEVRDTAGARVTAVATDTNRTITSTTAGAGLYVLSSLRPGPYRLEVEAQGFRNYVRNGLVLHTGLRTRADVALEVGAFAESTTVTANASLL